MFCINVSIIIIHLSRATHTVYIFLFFYPTESNRRWIWCSGIRCQRNKRRSLLWRSEHHKEVTWSFLFASAGRRTDVGVRSGQRANGREIHNTDRWESRESLRSSEEELMFVCTIKSGFICATSKILSDMVDMFFWMCSSLF